MDIGGQDVRCDQEVTRMQLPNFARYILRRCIRSCSENVFVVVHFMCDACHWKGTYGLRSFGGSASEAGFRSSSTNQVFGVAALPSLAAGKYRLPKWKKSCRELPELVHRQTILLYRPKSVSFAFACLLLRVENRERSSANTHKAKHTLTQLGRRFSFFYSLRSIQIIHWLRGRSNYTLQAPNHSLPLRIKGRFTSEYPSL